MDIHNFIAIFQVVLTFLAGIAASSGFWLYLDRRRNDRDLSRRLLIGLAHDRIIYLSMKYIERGWVTQDEHENLCQFLVEPYLEMGGNGSAKRLMDEVNKLPIVAKHLTDLKGTKDDVSEQQGI